MDMQNVQAQGGQSRSEKSPAADQSRGKEKMGDATEVRKEPSQLRAHRAQLQLLQ